MESMPMEAMKYDKERKMHTQIAIICPYYERYYYARNSIMNVIIVTPEIVL